MNMSRHFETAAREAAVIKKMLDDARRTIQIFYVDIATEEERAGVFDRSEPGYPVLARALAARRNNLNATIAELERFETIKTPRAEPVAA
jgi:hypothetical protein